MAVPKGIAWQFRGQIFVARDLTSKKRSRTVVGERSKAGLLVGFKTGRTLGPVGLKADHPQINFCSPRRSVCLDRMDLRAGNLLEITRRERKFRLL